MTEIDTDAIRKRLPEWPVPPRSADLILRLCDALDAARAEIEYLRDEHDPDRTMQHAMAMEDRAEQAEAAVARVRAYAEAHADWCCAKGCTVPEDRCDETCNCECGAILAALDGTTPPPSTGHRAPLDGPPTPR